MRRALPLALALLVPLSAAAAEKTLEEITTCAVESVPAHAHARVKLISRDEHGAEKELYAEYWSSEPELGKRRVVIASRDTTGGATAYLFREGDAPGEAWTWLEGETKARHVQVEPGKGRVLGLELGFEDVARIARILYPGQIRRRPDALLDGRTAWVLETTPSADAGSAYDFIVSWLDPETCALLQRESHLRGDLGATAAHVRRFRVERAALQRSGKHAHLTRALLETEGTGRRVSVQLEGLGFEPEPVDFFAPETLPLVSSALRRP